MFDINEDYVICDGMKMSRKDAIEYMQGRQTLHSQVTLHPGLKKKRASLAFAYCVASYVFAKLTTRVERESTVYKCNRTHTIQMVLIEYST